MKFAFCIGNGESRTGFHVEDLHNHGEIYGANAIFRYYPVDHLVCCDRQMAMETVKHGYTGTVYTRKEWYSFFPYDNFKCLPELPWPEEQKWTQAFHTGSGLHAVNLAVRNGADIVVLIGHDFWDTKGKHNNIYKGTENYWGIEHHAIDPSFWIKQFELFFNYAPDIQFVFCQPRIERWRKPDGWQFENVQFENLGSIVDALDQS